MRLVIVTLWNAQSYTLGVHPIPGIYYGQDFIPQINQADQSFLVKTKGNQKSEALLTGNTMEFCH